MARKTISKDDILRGLLKEIQGKYSFNPKEMATLIGKAEKTYYNRYNNPETLSVLELRRLVSRGYIKKEDLMGIF